MNNKILMMTMALLLAIVVASPAQSRFTDFEFLFGKWAGSGSGNPGEAIAGFTSFNLDLNQNILVRKNRAEFAPSAGQTQGMVHEDLLIIYPNANSEDFSAMYFDNESHVISYRVFITEPGTGIVLESTAIGGGSRFRLQYKKMEDGSLDNEFQIAPPGGDFKRYMQGRLKKAE
jgi:hypothetical protein